MSIENKTYDSFAAIHVPVEIESRSFFSRALYQLPLEGVTFLVASFALRIFNLSIAFPLCGIGVSIVTTGLVLKIVSCYDRRVFVDLTKEACKVNKNYPKLQMIGFIFSLALCWISKTLSMLVGAYLGSFGTIILDVENYKVKQRANRRLV